MKSQAMITMVVFLLVASASWGQVLPGTGTQDGEAAAATEDRAQAGGPSATVAMSDETYPVTPGDTYTLAYSFRGQLVDQSLVVTSDYKLDLGIFGVIDTKGLTYLDLKERVGTVISNYYPGSHPSIVLVSPGEFNITANRPGLGATRIVAWGLIRLGDVIDELELEDEYSQRNVLIISRDGRRNSYDYYGYLYKGIEASNPLMRPGDRIEFRYNRNRVEITGAVMSPGMREILPRDTMNDIVSYIGDFQSNADTSRIQKSDIVDGREVNSVHEWGDRALFAGHSEGIRIHVPSLAEARSPMYVEINSGQPIPPLRTEEEEEEEEVVTAEDETQVGRVIRLEIPVFEGMRISDLLGRIEPHFTEMSDLERSYLVREGADGPILINLESVMRSSQSPANVELKPGDTLGIPSRSVFVTVSGAVYEPGRYFYTPMRTAGYYITLAGGIDPEQGSHRNVAIYDEEGNEKYGQELVEPGDNIVVVQDNVAFQFNQKFGTVASALALITSLVTLITVTLAVN